MKKVLLFLMCVLLVGGIFTGCASKQTDGSSSERTVVDMKGKKIELPETIDSYCVLYSSAVPMCAMLDEDLKHMVMYPISNYFEYWYYEMFEGIKDHAVQVDKKNVTAEEILESGAQVVFWNRPAHEELVTSLEAAGIICINVQVQNDTELLRSMKIIADTFGTDFAENQYAKYEEKFKKYQDIAVDAASQIPENEKKTVLVIGSVDTPSVGATDDYQGYWTKLTGLINLSPVKPGETGATLTMEEIYEIDPDIIVAQGPFNRSQIMNDPQWSQVRAVKENTLFSNPSVLDEWGMPTTEAPLQFMWVLKQFYPEYAKDINAIEELKNFYKEFYDYEMSEKNAEKILNCRHFYIHEALKDFE